ncbi:hypothetical protein [Campylobacter phage CJLB-10]|nr:hypothetical protein [Campylobacter phage CJLB-10]
MKIFNCIIFFLEFLTFQIYQRNCFWQENFLFISIQIIERDRITY